MLQRLVVGHCQQNGFAQAHASQNVPACLGPDDILVLSTESRQAWHTSNGLRTLLSPVQQPRPSAWGAGP